LFTLLGSYKRFYAEQVCFGAMYPGIEVTEPILAQIRHLCTEMYKMNVFGYVTFELLVDNRSKEIYFSDIVPHLETYSELYFYYKRVLNIN
jgi:hypothetical protein